MNFFTICRSTSILNCFMKLVCRESSIIFFSFSGSTTYYVSFLCVQTTFSVAPPVVGKLIIEPLPLFTFLILQFIQRLWTSQNKLSYTHKRWRIIAHIDIFKWNEDLIKTNQWSQTLLISHPKKPFDYFLQHLSFLLEHPFYYLIIKSQHKNLLWTYAANLSQIFYTVSL